MVWRSPVVRLRKAHFDSQLEHVVILRGGSMLRVYNT